MKKLYVGFVALGMLLSGAALRAQDVTGSWQGTLEPPGATLRIVVKVTKEPDGLKAVFYSIDQGGQGFPTSGFTMQGSTVKFGIPAIAGNYEGRLAADGNSIAGNWSQGPGKLPLNLTRATKESAWVIPEPPPPPKTMTNPNPVFEVATIKPAQPGAQGMGIIVKGRQLLTINTSLSNLIAFSYGLHARQITGAPSWTEEDKYDIVAQPEGDGQPNERQLKTMLQKLLEDRFKLAFHRDKKELSVYAITVAKSGPKLTKSGGDPNGLPGIFFRGLGVMPAVNANMGDLAMVMQSQVLDRPVIDRTGISGRFDFTLTWTPDEFQFPGLGRGVPRPTDSSAPNLFQAIQEQLGLRLESTRADAEVIVIDKVEKPTEN